jgi:DNA helicase-2/ATP-dependent DNA helicase PcrA
MRVRTGRKWQRPRLVSKTPDRKDVLEAEGHVLVTGGPGCGKTTIALEKAMYAIESGLSSGQRILFLSFSRAAVARVLQGSRKQLPPSGRRLLDVQTFHSFFWGFLQGHAYLLGAPRSVQLLTPPDERVLRARACPDDEWRTETERLFIEDGRVVFDLFAPKCAELLTGSKALAELVANRYPLLVVDEAQDTGIDQWRCVAALAEKTQVVCLADVDQQIYDFRADVSPGRVEDIKKALNPLHLDLGEENNRSSATEILKFGNDILDGNFTQKKYVGVSGTYFSPAMADRESAIRAAVEEVRTRTLEATGNPPCSIAFLTRTNKGVAAISRALAADESRPAIGHYVAVDETLVALSTRVVAACLEPAGDPWTRLATALRCMGDYYRARQTKTGDNAADRLESYAAEANEGKTSRGRSARELKRILDELDTSPLSGNPQKDWIRIRLAFEQSTAEELRDIASHVVYLMAFNRGRLIGDSLSLKWTGVGYADARRVVEDAVAQDTLSSGTEEFSGLHAMTMHKSKGKEFDAVIVLHLGNISTFEMTAEPPKDARGRRLLRVAVTRARHHVHVLVDDYRRTCLLSACQE